MKQILFLNILTCFILLIGCTSEASEKVVQYQKNNEIIGEEREELIGEVSPTIYETIQRTNEEAEEILVSPIERPGVGITPSAGRYMIHTGEPGRVPQSGRVVVSDENGVILLEEVLGLGGVERVTLNLNGSHEVYFDGLDWAYLTPVPTEQLNELTAGIWEVGADIAAGSYTVVAASELEFGYLQIFEEGNDPRIFEIINSPSIQVEIKEGQILKINGVSYLKFE